MEPNDIRKHVNDMTEIVRVYSESEYRLVESLLANRTVDSMLDVSAIPQSFIFRASGKLHPTVALAVADEDLFEIAVNHPLRERMPNHCADSGVSWTTDESIARDDKFDVVFGILANTDDLENALMHLKPDGIGLFHAGVDFFRPDFEAGNVGLTSLGPLGKENRFYVQAALLLSSGLIGAATDEYNYECLMVIEQSEQQDLFIGTVSDDSSMNTELLSNMRTRKQGRTFSRGFITDVEYLDIGTFWYWDETLALWGTLRGFELLASFVCGIEFLEPDDSSARPNSIVLDLPRADAVGPGSVRVVLDRGAMSAEYLQLFLDETKRRHEQMILKYYGTDWAGYTDWRKEWLDGCTSYVEIVHRILNTPVLTTDSAIQSEMLALAVDTRNLSSHIEMQQKRMWTEPEMAANIRRQLSPMSRSETFESWLATLPFPLAAILWAYNAVSDRKEKLEHLFNFFEAMAEFNTTLILSGLVSGDEVVRTGLGQLADEHVNYEFLRVCHMGTWVALGARAARLARSLLSDRKSRNTLLASLGNIPLESADMISSKDLWVILSDARDKRNVWKGHTGIVGRPELDLRLKHMEGLLSRVRRVVSDSFEPVWLVIRKSEIAFRQGIHEYEAFHLRGHSMGPLPEVRLSVEFPLVSDELYMTSKDGRRPAKVLPFVIVREIQGTGNRACYFYNREDHGKARFVSYHFAEESEVLLDWEVVRPVLQAFEEKSGTE